MEARRASPVKAVALLSFQSVIFVYLIAQAICWLSGWSILSLLNLGEELSPEKAALQPDRTFALSPAVLEMMKQVGVIHSACYEEQRKDPNEFLVCVGRLNCADAKKTETITLVGAPEVLKTPEGNRKMLEVTQMVMTHVAQEVQTGDLRAIMVKVKEMGLACDNLRLPLASQPAEE
ncbi:hypothetical protein Efla_005360 [Eimeria flavescens]